MLEPAAVMQQQRKLSWGGRGLRIRPKPAAGRQSEKKEVKRDCAGIERGFAEEVGERILDREGQCARSPAARGMERMTGEVDPRTQTEGIQFGTLGGERAWPCGGGAVIRGWACWKEVRALTHGSKGASQAGERGRQDSRGKAGLQPGSGGVDSRLG